MSGIIHVLDTDTINRIAAGEVVERPASVVKELVENAVDAGADAVTVEIKEGGISYIRVTDNGSGIDRDQIRTAFLRHTTSKISSAEDLVHIASLGFRGEALSSIAAVSQVELLTKTKTSVTGIRYCLEGTRETVFDDVGVPDGTTFIVRNLFFNTPARRKFLKTPQTEGGYISDYMERVMLSHTEIAFKLIVNGNVLNTPNFFVNALLSYRFNKTVRANIGINYCGKQYFKFRIYENPIDWEESYKEISQYFLVNPGLNFDFGKLKLDINIHNVFNHKYSLGGNCFREIPQKGLWLMAGVSYNF